MAARTALTPIDGPTTCACEWYINVQLCTGGALLLQQFNQGTSQKR
jgi:hypothetical protein